MATQVHRDQRTYQQSSVVNSNAINIDPSNELLSYFPRTRLDAEVIRDSILQSAKLLSPKMYGPPVKPLQPAVIGAQPMVPPSGQRVLGGPLSPGACTPTRNERSRLPYLILLMAPVENPALLNAIVPTQHFRPLPY